MLYIRTYDYVTTPYFSDSVFNFTMFFFLHFVCTVSRYHVTLELKRLRDMYITSLHRLAIGYLGLIKSMFGQRFEASIRVVAKYRRLVRVSPPGAGIIKLY